MTADEIFQTFNVTREQAERLASLVNLRTMESRTLERIRARAGTIAARLVSGERLESRDK